MVVLLQHINSHYCSTEPPGIYNDKFLLAWAHQDLIYRPLQPLSTLHILREFNTVDPILDRKKNCISQMSLICKPGNKTVLFLQSVEGIFQASNYIISLGVRFFIRLTAFNGTLL